MFPLFHQCYCFCSCLEKKLFIVYVVGIVVFVYVRVCEVFVRCEGAVYGRSSLGGQEVVATAWYVEMLYRVVSHLSSV